MTLFGPTECSESFQVICGFILFFGIRRNSPGGYKSHLAVLFFKIYIIECSIDTESSLNDTRGTLKFVRVNQRSHLHTFV